MISGSSASKRHFTPTPLRQPHPLSIQKVDVQDEEYSSETPERMRNENFPGFPTCSVFVGMPGSGKTNTLIYMLLHAEFWYGFFDEIYFFGPTVKSDKLYERVKLPDDHIINEVDEMLPKLSEIINKQQGEVERDKKKAPKLLVVFEDITSFFYKIQNKTEFHRLYVQIRHLKGSVVSMVHKYKSFNRTCRMSSRHLLVWECNKSEREQLYHDFGPPQLTMKDWFEMMDEALTPSKDCPKPFFYINMSQPVTTRFRRCFTEVLELPDPRVPVDMGQAYLDFVTPKSKNPNFKPPSSFGKKRKGNSAPTAKKRKNLKK